MGAMSTGERGQVDTVAATTHTTTTRRVELDGLRGLAILAMVVDHSILVFGGPEILRHTVGNLAMPTFFVLAGHLATRPRMRHAYIGALGVGLAWLIPWLDSPNVLTIWAVGVVLLWGLRAARVPVLLLPAVGLTAMAHGWVLGGSGFYDPLALWSLMALGAVVPATAFAWAAHAPAWVARVGTRPVIWYAGHLVVIQTASMLLANS